MSSESDSNVFRESSHVPSGSHSTTRLVKLKFSAERLNDDVLYKIIYFVRMLKPLSSTSKRLRAICLPQLFETVYVWCTGISWCPPPVSWPYIKTLILAGSLSEEEAFHKRGVYQAVPHLVSLRTVHFSLLDEGAQWPVLKTLFSAPNLFTLKVTDHAQLDPADVIEDDDDTPVHMPIIKYVYTVTRFPPPYIVGFMDPPERRCYMNPLVLRMHTTLQALNIPSDTAPMDKMAQVEWPRLRELSFSGDLYPTDDATLLLCMLSRMSNLHALHLHVEHRQGSGRTLIWPHDTSDVASFDHLKSVFLPYPDPDDYFYLHLPDTLLRLRLVDWPRHYRFLSDFYPDIRRAGELPLLSATRMLHVLQQCNCPVLEELAISFRADGQDSALFRHIATNFPRLRSLEFHRYRAEGEMNIDATVIRTAETLASLRSLRCLRAQLDPPEVSGSYNNLVTANGRHAHTFARMLAPSLDVVYLLSAWTIRSSSAKWEAWDVMRDRWGKAGVEYDHKWTLHPMAEDDIS